MNTSVAGHPRLTTQHYWRNSTSPSILSIFHVFGYVSLMRALGWIIRSINDAFAPAPGQRLAACGISFCDLCHFCDFAKYRVA